MKDIYLVQCFKGSIEHCNLKMTPSFNSLDNTSQFLLGIDVSFAQQCTMDILKKYILVKEMECAVRSF